jgi:predicted nucleic acid-binding protein
MQEIVESEVRSQPERLEGEAPLVFLDTNVILDYLRGEQSAVQLFSAESNGRIRFAINPIVLQELLLSMDATAKPEFNRIIDHLKLLPINFAKAEALAAEASKALKTTPEAPAVRKRLPHSNDLIILSSVGDCDFLVTSDRRLMDLVANGRPQIVTPRELVARLRAA